MPKVNITLSQEIWEWWQANRWVNLSQLLEKELWRIHRMEAARYGGADAALGGCPRCGNQKLRFVDGVNYKCSKCGTIV